MDAQLSLFHNQESKQNKNMSILEQDAINLLALAGIEGAGFSAVRSLYLSFETILPTIWDADPDYIFSILTKARIPSASNVVQQIKNRKKELLKIAEDRYAFYLNKRHIQILFRNDPRYPQKLRDIPNPPLWLFVEGSIDILQGNPIIALVGTRTPTEQGLESAKAAALGLAHYGCTILSGLAEGIDEVAHKIAVDHSTPTIAVVGHGIDVIYPAATSYLRRHIITTGGAIVSEYLPLDSYTRDRFVQRNRIQVGLSDVVGIIEGALKSGTAHTVNFARRFKRPLFGVRSSELDTNSQQHELLFDIQRSGAPVFDFQSQIDKRKFIIFINDMVGMQLERNTPNIFTGIMNEIIRLSNDYEAREQDISWLIDELSKLQSKKRNKQ